MAMGAVCECRGLITRAAINVVAAHRRGARRPSTLSSVLSSSAKFRPSWCASSSFPSGMSRMTVVRRCTSLGVSQSLEADLFAPPSEVAKKCVLRNLSYSELAAWVESVGYKKSQALMLWRCLYGSGKWATTVDEMRGLSKEFRKTLRDRAELNVLKIGKVHTAADGTRKMVFWVEGGSIETVVIPCAGGRGRTTVCVSSQVGCAMNCQFCFTGRMGLKRNLTTAEIVEQLVVACRLFSKDVGAITNVVFMVTTANEYIGNLSKIVDRIQNKKQRSNIAPVKKGITKMGMGEPLHNADNVIRAANIMIDDHGFHLSHNKVTVSTSGLVPQIHQFYRKTICSLAVSLNATTDEVRNWIMPINRKYSLNVLMNTLRKELSSTPERKVFFEYVMLAGVNDSVDDAHRLVKLVEGVPCKINLICFNEHSESGFRPSPNEQMLLFRDIVTRSGLTVHIRRSRGDDQMAACGQLGTLGVQQAPRMSVPKQFQAALVA